MPALGRTGGGAEQGKKQWVRGRGEEGDEESKHRREGREEWERGHRGC